MSASTAFGRAIRYVVTSLGIFFGLLLWFAFGPQDYIVPKALTATVYIALLIGLPLFAIWYWQRWKRGLSDAFWYLTSGLLVLLGGMLWLTYVPESVKIPEKWTLTGPIAALMFVLVLRTFRNTRKSSAFWALLIALFAVYEFIFAEAFATVRRQPILYLIFGVGGVMLIQLILSKVFHAIPGEPDI